MQAIPALVLANLRGLGTGIATALGINVGSAGSVVVNGGALGTPSSGVATNLTGTASGLTAGTATALATARAIYGNNFDGTAALTQIIASTYGGTGNGFTKFSGPTTAERTFTLPDASATIVTQGGALGTPASGTLTNCTGLPAAGVVGTAAVLGANTFTALQTMQSGIRNSDGTASAPAYSFTSVTNAGFYISNSTTCFASAGTLRAAFGGSGVAAVNGLMFGWSTSPDSVANNTAISRISDGLVGVGTGSAGSFAGSVKLTDIFTNNATYLVRTNTALTDNAAAQTGTLGNAPTAGNPTKWIAIDDNGTKRMIPTWT